MKMETIKLFLFNLKNRYEEFKTKPDYDYLENCLPSIFKKEKGT